MRAGFMKRGKAANTSCPASPSRPAWVKNDARYAPGARPNAIANLGLGGAIAYFESLIQAAADSVPECASRQSMRELVWQESERLVPRSACNEYRNVGLPEATV